jgi:hypothetical protein
MHGASDIMRVVVVDVVVTAGRDLFFNPSAPLHRTDTGNAAASAAASPTFRGRFAEHRARSDRKVHATLGTIPFNPPRPLFAMNFTHAE